MHFQSIKLAEIQIKSERSIRETSNQKILWINSLKGQAILTIKFSVIFIHGYSHTHIN